MWQSIASGISTFPGSEFNIGGESDSDIYAQIDFFEAVTFNAVPNDTQKDALVSNMLAHFG